MYNSKSELTAFEQKKLRFECEQIALWCNANRTTTIERSAFITDPNWEAAAILPVKFLGSGIGGSAYALTNWPGLVLKLCRNQRDMYPDWVRGAAGVKLRSFLPKVFMLGGDELRGTFWCVLPEYKGLEEPHRDRATKAHLDKAAKLLALMEDRGRTTKQEWVRGYYTLDGKVCDRMGWELTPEEADRRVYHEGYSKQHKERTIKPAGISKKERRVARRMSERGVRELYFAANNSWDLHAGNIMLDSLTGQLIITDPIYACDAVTKEELRANVKW